MIIRVARFVGLGLHEDLEVSNHGLTEARLEAIEVDVFTPEQFYATVNGHGGLDLEDVPTQLAANG